MGRSGLTGLPLIYSKWNLIIVLHLLKKDNWRNYHIFLWKHILFLWELISDSQNNTRLSDSVSTKIRLLSTLNNHYHIHNPELTLLSVQKWVYILIIFCCHILIFSGRNNLICLRCEEQLNANIDKLRFETYQSEVSASSTASNP